MGTGLDAQQKIFTSNPDDRRAFEALEEHYFLEGDWDALVRVYRERLAAPSLENEPDLQTPLLFRLGQVLEERILNLNQATEVYWQLARLDPSNRAALRQLRGIHERRSQWDMVLQIAELEGANPMPAYERAAFETELGRTWQIHLEDPEEALVAYGRALEADPDYPAALEGLAQLHRAAGRFTETAAILERLTRRLRGPERAPVWIALGGLYAGPLESPTRARECFSSALDDDPFQAPAVEWSLLLATAAEDWPAVSELLESRFDLASGARHRSAIAVEASQIQLNHLGSKPSARAWVDRALELSSDEPSVLLAASDVERADGDREALLKNLDRLITVMGNRASLSALVEAAELYSEFGNPDSALDAIRRAADRADGSDENILTLHAKLLRDGGSKRELAEVLETLTALGAGSDASLRAEQLRELAALQEEDLGDSESAAFNWQRAFDLAPGDPTTLDALERIYRKQDDWTALRRVLETALELSGDSVAPGLPTRLGTLLLDEFDETDLARSSFERALSGDPDHAPALAGLRRIADLCDDPDLLLEVCTREARDDVDAATLGKLAQSAIPILEERDELEEALHWATRWSESAPSEVGALSQRADLEKRLDRPEAEITSRQALAQLQSGSEKGMTCERLAELHLALGQESEAVGAFERALETEPDSLEILDQLSDLYRGLDQPRELSRILQQRVDLSPAGEQADRLEELASTLQDPIGDLDRAIVIRWRLVDLPDAPSDASLKLESLLDLTGRYADLSQLLTARRSSLDDGSSEAARLDLRQGKLLLDNLGQSQEASGIFSALHEDDPEDTEIAALYERALRQSDDATGLSALLERRIGWETDESTRSELRLERATLLDEALGDPEAACDLYEVILDEHPSTDAAESAGERFEILLESTGQWGRLRDRLLERADTLSIADQAVLREQIATLCRERLNDLPGCAAQLEIVAEQSPDQVHIWQKLQGIYAHELERPQDWLRVVQAELDCDPASDRERVLRIGAARLLLDDERRPSDLESDEAYAHYERVLDLDASHPEAVEALANHWIAEERHADAARILEDRLASFNEAEGSEATALRIRLARLYAGSLEDDERAGPLFEKAQQSAGVVPEIAEPLAELYERTENHDALCNLSRKVIDSGLSKDRRANALHTWRLRLAASERALGRDAAAAAAYRDALAGAPGDRDIEDALIELYEALDEVDPLSQLLEKRLSQVSEEENIEIRMRLAGLHAERRDDPTEALRHLDWILDADPQHRGAYHQALDLAERTQDHDRQARLLGKALELPLASDERAEMLERRAHLFSASLGDPEQAVTSLREAIACDRTRTSARHALRSQLERLERWPAVLDCYFSDATEADGEERFALLEEASELAREKINPDASLPWLARMREERPEDPELFSRLADVHRQAGRFEASLSALDDELARREEPSALCALHLQRARMLERDLESPGRAVGAYLAALPLAENGREILTELDRLYQQLDRPVERAEILESKVKLLQGAEEIEARSALASLYCVELLRPEKAIAHLQFNAEAHRGQPEQELTTLGALDSALRASARLDEWIPVAERELHLIESDAGLSAATPADFKRFLREELARAYDERMGDPESALGHLRALCAADESARASQAPRICSLLRRTGRITELAAELGHQLDSGLGGGSEWMEVARLREESLLDLEGARDAFQKAASDPELRLAAVRGARRCNERLRDWNALAENLEDEYRLEASLSRSERITIAHTLGDLYWHRLTDGDLATRAYQKALDLDSQDLEALRAMIAVQEACENPREASNLYRRELEVLGEDSKHRARRVEIWLRLATLLSENGGEPSEALDAYREASEIDRLSPADELKFAELYRDAGDLEAYCTHFGSWCDREQSPARVTDHLALVDTLLSRGETEAARARCQRATAVDPESSKAWAVLAKLTRARGSMPEAAEAYERAAEHASPSEAASHRVEAAACLEETDVVRSYNLLTAAAELDPASLPAHAALTRIAAQLDHVGETQREAERTLELACADDLTAEERLEIAVLGGRAAQKQADRDASRRLFEQALELDANHVEALEGVGLAYFEDGDFRSARAHLERRIDFEGTDSNRSKHLAIVARGLEAEDDLDAAAARYEEAITEDRHNETAHEGAVRLHERAGRTREALDSLERWAKSADDAKTRALAGFRAAEHAMALDDPDRARRQLDFATTDDPQLAPAWVMLCDLVADRGPENEARGLCRRALEAIEPSEHSAKISLRAARLAEVAGETAEARARYGEAARWDPRSCDAALSESRLARMDGDWVEADGVLSHFIEAHPDPTSPTLAQVHLERGRLLSGPLEEFEKAIACYETALTLQPEMAVARTNLAGLLVHAPERWQEALNLHRAILENSPTTAKSLRAIRKIAEGRRQTEVADGALAVLRALGLATPEEDKNASAALRFPIHPGPPMSDTQAERLRRMAHQVADELKDVLREDARPRPTSKEPEIDQAIERIAALEDELSAPYLARLNAEERSDLFVTLAALFLDPGGNGPASRFQRPLDETLGRWTRRKVRRIVDETNLEAIVNFDHQAWGDELRAIAAAQSIDRSGGELRDVLRALIIFDGQSDSEPEFHDADLSTLASTSDSARRLLARITSLLCERLDRSR